MPTLEEKLKAEAKVQKEKAALTYDKVPWFKPDEGANLFRIMPDPIKPNEELFFRAVMVHFGVEIPKTDGTGTVAIPVRCPRQFGKVCGICDLWDACKSKEQRKELNVVRPQERYLYNILSMKAQADGSVKGEFYVWAMPTSVHSAVFAWVDDMGSTIADLKVGHDWRVVKEVEKGKPAALGTSYKLFPRLAATAVPAKLVEDWEKKVHNLSDLYKEDHTDAVAKTAAVMARKIGMSATPNVATVASAKPASALAVADDGFAGSPKTAPVTTAAPAVDDGFASTPKATVKVDDPELEAELKELGV